MYKTCIKVRSNNLNKISCAKVNLNFLDFLKVQIKINTMEPFYAFVVYFYLCHNIQQLFYEINYLPLFF